MTKPLVAALVLALQTPSAILRFEADGFWLNLHHFLYVLGRAQSHAADAQRRAVVNAPADQETGLRGQTASAVQAWESAVRFYANGLSKNDAVFDDDLIAVTNAMRVASNAAAETLKIDPALRAALVRAAPVYRDVWWPRHQAENHARVREYQRLLEQHGDMVLRYVTRAYQLEWPAGGHLINVSAYANWAGAYSTDGGLIVISSLDEGTKGSLGLESMFHESMHQWDQPMLARLSTLAQQHHTPAPRDGITHALIWYTAAEAVRRAIPGHVGYAERGGIWKQKQIGSFKSALDTYWKPYLDGTITLDEALLGVLKS
jgi:hypothetical protein